MSFDIESSMKENKLSFSLVFIELLIHYVSFFEVQNAVNMPSKQK